MSQKKIVAICCENSGFKAAQSIRDSAAMKSVTVLKVPCAGNVEVGGILKHFEEGADKVLVLGCPLENCKYLRGNRRALKRVAVARQALKDAGLEETRLRIELISSVDDYKLTGILKEMQKE